MKFHYLLFIILLVFSCEAKKENTSLNPENWSKRAVKLKASDSLEYGKSYLSIYSQIYSLTEHTKHNLTSMVSMRNTSDKDTIYLLRAEYYDTHGKSVRKYF
ncbi:DUF3124 domain-containing protein, partial [Mesoflavibacter zeaxanthinifaciens]|uniref:DUF3124 domain-containing protein n=1 Tax=Mesoflavibacter zeaxanthinifaciens TaxID=393060 RepID=UPI0026E9F57C